MEEVRFDGPFRVSRMCLGVVVVVVAVVVVVVALVVGDVTVVDKVDPSTFALR